MLEGPVLITNTNAVGVLRDAVIQYAHERWGEREGWADALWSLPVVAETWDGSLNDIYGGHVKAAHARQAIEAARPGPVAEGAVGGGTGMICYEFKGGIGTASRVLPADRRRLHGRACSCRPTSASAISSASRACRSAQEIREGASRATDSGSIIILVATDAPLLPHQLKRLARRAALGLARTGSVAGNGSGDLLPGLLDREPPRGRAEGHGAAGDVAQRAHGRAVRGDGGRDRRGHRQRARRRPHDDRPQGLHRARPARTTAWSSCCAGTTGCSRPPAAERRPCAPLVLALAVPARRPAAGGCAKAAGRSTTTKARTRSRRAATARPRRSGRRRARWRRASGRRTRAWARR